MLKIHNQPTVNQTIQHFESVSLETFVTRKFTLRINQFWQNYVWWIGSRKLIGDKIVYLVFHHQFRLSIIVCIVVNNRLVTSLLIGYFTGAILVCRTLLKWQLMTGIMLDRPALKKLENIFNIVIVKSCI